MGSFDHDGKRVVDAVSKDEPRYFEQITGSLFGAVLLLTWDAVICGSFTFSVAVCPIWLVISLVRAVVKQPELKVGLSRVVMPPLTLVLVLANARLQSTVASANADRIIRACEQFCAASGEYPKALEELVPRYLESVPRAKYCLIGKFEYWNLDGHAELFWVEVPPFGRRGYDFGRGRWWNLD